MEDPVEVRRLRLEVARTREMYTRARRDYESAVAVAKDTGFSSDGSRGLKLATSRYATAMREYNSAVQQLTDYHLKGN